MGHNDTSLRFRLIRCDPTKFIIVIKAGPDWQEMEERCWWFEQDF